MRKALSKKNISTATPTPASQAHALDTLRIGVADPGCGYPVAPACAIIVDGGPAKKDRFCRTIEAGSFSEIQEDAPEGAWGACLSCLHGYSRQWLGEFLDIVEVGVQTGTIPGSITKIAVLFSAWHWMDDELIGLRRSENIAVILDHNGAFECSPDEMGIGNAVIAARSKAERKARERREVSDHAPRIDWDDLDRDGKLYDAGGGWIARYKSR